MSDTSDEGAVRVGEKFRQLIESLDVPVDNKRTTLLTVSVGVGSFRQGSVPELVREAELALAAARDAGGNRTEVRVLELATTGGTIS